MFSRIDQHSTAMHIPKLISIMFASLLLSGKCIDPSKNILYMIAAIPINRKYAQALRIEPLALLL